jgi:hypothetical protein
MPLISQSRRRRGQGRSAGRKGGGRCAAPKKPRNITPGEAQAVDPAGQAPLDDSITCLARTIYWEAKAPTPKT